jgi:fructose-1,6-bisphosphatase-3
MTPSPYLAALARRFPSSRAALAEIAHLEAILTLPTWAVHVVSDVHGEEVKFRHVVNNASGTLRPRLERLFGNERSEDERAELLALFYYPRETWTKLTGGQSQAARTQALVGFAKAAAVVLRDLAQGLTLRHVLKVLPEPLDELFLELLFARELGRSDDFAGALVGPFVRAGRDLELVRLIARAVRNLSVGELVVAGDLGDRGPRIDGVIEHMRKQPRVAITWGNHDALWMGACLGQPALVATVLRLSLRYRRLSQLEEGYGVTLQPLEHLARTVYADDPAERFAVKGEGLRDPLLMARMQKAAAVLEWKTSGALVARHPEWDLGKRVLLTAIDPKAGTVTIDGRAHPLLDRHFPTVDWAEPLALSETERQCMERTITSFKRSTRLWEHMSFLAQHGSMWLRRDRALIFHGCVPVADDGTFLALEVDGVQHRGRALFDALERVVARAFRRDHGGDLDWFWYLWSGERSPCFGKDRMATFETYLIADKATHHEHKNPYFRRLADADFCARVLTEFGVAPDGLIVNGHVPVRPDKGEAPLKASGRAVTIDGAFAAAYGDRGYSLVLDAHRTWLAEHHHFDGPDGGAGPFTDIVPTVTVLRAEPRPRTVADTETGQAIRDEIGVLEDLVNAYAENRLIEAE